jgi:thiol:disulfide interchange protein
MKRYALLYLIFIFSISSTEAQIENPVKWQFDYLFINQKSVQLRFTATIEQKWHMYGAFFPEGGPIPTSFHFDSSQSFKILGPVTEVTPPVTKKDPNFDNMIITLHNNKAVFAQKISLNTNEPIIIKGYVEFMACNDQKCLPPKDINFAIKIIPQKEVKQTANIEDNSKSIVKESKLITNNQVSDSANSKVVVDIVPHASEKSDTNKSLWQLFIKAILAGFGGVFTPCVYPMIPLTVLFFLKGNEKRSRAILKGIIFGLSIIIIYLFIGLLLGKIIQLIATNWIANLFFFILFIAFALSFLGLFEIVLPGSLATKVDQQADKGGFFSVFFMALALVIVSSSCTVPIIGSVLIEGSSNLTQSAVSMLGYSLAFALPFSFFAVFPELLKSLPHSGGWMNAFKVIIGLIILMFSFKYLVIVDQSLHLNLLSREIVLSIWTVY